MKWIKPCFLPTVAHLADKELHLWLSFMATSPYLHLFWYSPSPEEHIWAWLVANCLLSLSLEYSWLLAHSALL